MDLHAQSGSGDKPAVVFVGHVCLDRNDVEGSVYRSWGSPAMYMTKYMQAEYGLEPVIITRFGKDFLPFAAGVRLLPPSPDDMPTLTYENIVRGGKRTQYCRHADLSVPDPLTLDGTAVLGRADILFVAPLTPAYRAGYVRKVAESVPPSCLKVLLPQGYLRSIGDDGLVRPRDFTEAPDVVPLFDLIILSDEDHPEAISQAREWKRFAPKTNLIVTRNAAGADIVLAEGITNIPTTPIPPSRIIDSVGCGDVFSVAMAYEYAFHGDLVSAVRAGHSAAGRRLQSPLRHERDH